jgi:hypothetical protein
MSLATNYASALHQYDQQVWNTQQKMMQERSLHSQDLVNTYMEAVLSGVPSNYLSMIEAMIADRSAYNTRKMLLDAAELTKHQAKLKAALGAQVGVLSGGAVALSGGASSKSAIKSFDYAGKRSNALLSSMYTKLSHDRSVHMHELNNLHAEEMKLSGGQSTAFSTMLSSLINDRRTFNARKTALDAGQWTALQSNVRKLSLTPLLSAGEKKCKCRTRCCSSRARA